MSERATGGLAALLASKRGAWVAPLAAALLTLPSLAGGIVRGDDSLQLLKARGALAHGLGRLDLFDFVPGTPQGNRTWADLGLLPWTAAPDLRLAFFRPISSLSAAFDYVALARAPWVMHAESVALYAGVVAIAAAAYRRLLPRPVALLAGLLYAIDDGHLFPVSWLANRNALFAAGFGVLAVLLHDRWRRDGWRAGAALGPLALLGGLLSAEMGIAALGYVAAHAATLDPQRSRAKRAAVLLPYAVVIVLWQVAYRALGYGSRGSGYYIDPVASPGVFARLAPLRLAALLLGQLALPPSDVSAYVPSAVAAAIAALGAALVIFVGKVVAPDVRRDPALRFFTLGALLSAVPMLAIIPSDRLLVLVGFGAFGVIAHVIGDLAGAPPGLPRSTRALRGAWIVVHLFVAPVVLALGCLVPLLMNHLGERPFTGARLGPEIGAQTLVLVNVPNVFAYQPLLFPPDDASPRPAHLRTLATTALPVEVSRLDARTLRLEVAPGPKKDTYERLYRSDAHRIREGASYEVPGLRIDVERVDADGDPTVFRARWGEDLGSASLRWLAWKDGKLVDFAPPPVGGRATVGPA